MRALQIAILAWRSGQYAIFFKFMGQQLDRVVLGRVVMAGMEPDIPPAVALDSRDLRHAVVWRVVHQVREIAVWAGVAPADKELARLDQANGEDER